MSAARISAVIHTLVTPLRHGGARGAPFSRMRLAIVGAAAYVLVFATWFFSTEATGRLYRVQSDLLFLPTFLAPSLGAWWSARRASGTARRAWGALAVSYAVLFVSSCVWLAADLAASSLETPWRLATLGIILASYPPLLYGLLRFPVAPRTASERVRLALDAMMGIAGTVALFWFTVLRNRPTESPLTLVDSLVVWGDVVVIATIVTLLVRLPESGVRVAMRYLVAGHVLSVFGGLSETWFDVVGITPQGSVVELIWIVSDALLFIGTMRGGSGQAARVDAPEEDSLLGMAIPYLSVAVAAGLLVAVTWRQWSSTQGVVIGFNVLVFGLLAVRQWCARRDLRRLVAERLAQEAHFRSLVQHASDVITVVDADGAIRFHSPAITRVLGYAPAEWIGRRLLELAHADDRAAAEGLLVRARVLPGEPASATVRVRHRLGQWVALEMVATDLLEDHAVRGIVVNGRDVGERLRLEDALRHAQKMDAVGRLAGGVAHDFNNLLAAIRGNAGLIRAASREGDSRHEDAAEIELAVDRAAALTRQLLSFSRRQIVAPSVVDLNAVVATTERLLRRLLPSELEYRASLDEALWPVRADAAQLEQVAMNLVLNARDALPAGGRIDVETRNEVVDADRASAIPGLVPGDWVVLCVRDTGIGMDATVRAHLFEPFFTTKPDGTGLGLSTVFGIVAQAGGHVAVESAPGKGAAFRVYLPRAHGSPAAAAEPCADDPTSGRGRETILVVDDEESVRSTIRRILQRRGYSVLTAEHGADALAVAAAHDGDVHLLVTDLSMPVMDGHALMEAFRDRWPEVPVVCMSGYSPDAELREAISRRADSFLAKPFSVDGLARMVRTALDGRPVPAATA